LFGKEVIAQALACIVVRAVSTVAFYFLLVRTGASRIVAVLLSGVFIGMFWTTSPELSSYDAALPLLLVTIHRMVAYFQSGDRSELRWAGLFVGLAAFFKHDLAAYIAAAAVGSLFLAWILAGSRRPAAWLTPTRAVLHLIGVAVPIVLVIGVWVAWNAGMAAWQDLFVFPATIFREVREEGYPRLFPLFEPLLAWLQDWSRLAVGFRAFEGISQWILSHLPEYIFVAVVAVVTLRRHKLEAATLATISFFLAAMPWFWLAAHVQRNTHLYSMAILSFVLGSMAWHGTNQLGGRSRAARRALAAVLAVYVAGLWIPPAMSLVRLVMDWPGIRATDIDGIRGIYLRPKEYQVYNSIGRLVRERTSPDERIYHGVLRHESIVINNPILYTVAGRRSCCRYSELHPGVTDRDSVQREIIDDVEKHNVRVVILWKFGWSKEVLDGIRDRNRAAVEDGGSTRLNEYIAREYEPIAEVSDEYVLMWRKDSAGGSDAPGS
jgi:hypothetical protein